jgi:membrane protein implicated in regulation of membrane protease activity
VPTNADRVVGQAAMVVERVDNAAAAGAVRTDGKIWTARSSSGEPIEVGIGVKVLFIEGVKLIVEPLPSSAEAQ